MKTNKQFITVLAMLFLCGSVLWGVPAATGQTSVSVTLQAYPHGSAIWQINSVPMSQSGQIGPTTTSSPAQTVLPLTSGTSLTVDAVPQNNYAFEYWQASVNGQVMTTDTHAEITFTLSTTSFTLAAYFVPAQTATYHISALANYGAEISPAGDVVVNAGASQTFYYSAIATGYELTTVTVDGSTVALNGFYTFTNVQANHAITVNAAPIPSTQIQGTFVNNTGGGLSWENDGQGPLPPLNPVFGFNGTWGFTAGDNLRVQAFPDAAAGYVFANFTYTVGTVVTPIYTNPYYITVSSTFTLTANFKTAPSAVFEVDFATTTGGVIHFDDTTAATSGDMGNNPALLSHLFALGDNVTFTAEASGTYYYLYMKVTGAPLPITNPTLLSTGTTTATAFTVIIQTNFTIAAYFSKNLLSGDSIGLTISPTPLSGEPSTADLLMGNCSFVLEQGVNYIFTFYPTENFATGTVGHYNISATGKSYSVDVVTDFGNNSITTFAGTLAILKGLHENLINNLQHGRILGLIYAMQNGIAPAYQLFGGAYSQIALNQAYTDAFSLNMLGTPIGQYDEYQGLSISISLLDGTQYNSPIYTLNWLTTADAAAYGGPAATATVPPSGGPSSMGLGEINSGGLGNVTAFLIHVGLGILAPFVWSPVAVLLYGIIVLMGMTLGLTYIMRRRDPTSGLCVGLAVSLVVDKLLFLYPLWTLIIVVMCIIVLIVTKG